MIQYYPRQDPLRYLQLGDLYQKTGQAYAACETIRKAKRIFPNSPDVERATWKAGAD